MAAAGAAIAVALLIVLDQQEQEYRRHVEAHLSELSWDRINLLELWKRERLGDARLMQQRPDLQAAARRALSPEGGDASGYLREQLGYLIEYYPYNNIWLVDGAGNPAFDAKGTGKLPIMPGGMDLRSALRQESVRLFLTEMDKGDIGTLMVVPLVGTPAPGAFLLGIEGDSALKQSFIGWSLFSRSGRVEIHPTDQLPALYRGSSLGVPAEGSRASQQVVYGTDSDGVPFVAVVGAIPDSDWSLVVRVSEAEAFALWRHRLWSLLVLAGSLLLCMVLLLLAYVQRVNHRHDRDVMEARTVAFNDERRHTHIVQSLREGVIITDARGNVRQLNPKAEELTGWKEAEAAGRPLAVIYRLSEPGTGRTLEPMEKSRSRSGWTQKLVHSFSGETHTVADSLTVIRDQEGQSEGFVLLVWDITEKSIQETRLRESEERFRSLFDQSVDGILLLDAGGLVVVGNPAAAGILRVPLEQVPGLAFPDILRSPASDETMDLECLDKPTTLEAQITRRDGSDFPAEVRMSALRFGGNNYRLVVVRDISRRKAAETALAESERRMATLIGNLQGIVYRCQMDREWTMQFMSAGAEEITGYAPEEFLGNARRSYGSLIHPGDRQRVWEEISRATHAGLPFVLEYRILTADGSVKWVWEQGMPVEQGGMSVLEGYITDITERQRTRHEMELLRTAMEHAGDAVLITDPDARIVYANPAFEHMTGYAREEVLGQNPRFLKSGQQDAAHYQQFWQTILSGETWQGRMINRKKNGELYTEESIISPIFDGDRRICNFLAIKRDITQESLIEEQLRQAQKMEALGQLAGGIAHDFNNILQVIQGCTGLLMEKLGDAPDEREYVQEIGRAAHRAAELTRQLLALGRRQILEKKTIDLADLVGGLAKMIRRILPEHIELHISALEPRLPIHADPGQLEQVLMNLCVNARDAMPDGGSLFLETGRLEVAPGSDEASGLIQAGSYALLRVRDTGQGMDEEVRSRIFNPFFTTKEPGRGTGLGLSMVYGIVRQHGGHIRVDSEVGRGTQFEILLPAAQCAPETAEDGTPAVVASPKGHGRILLVEDDEMVRKLTGDLLRQAGYEVESAADGVEAIQWLERGERTVDLLLSDVVMPRGGGKMVWEALRRHHPKARVLFMTGYATGVFDESDLKHLQSSFIGKPFTPAQLLAKVRSLLDQARAGDSV